MSFLEYPNAAGHCRQWIAPWAWAICIVRVEPGVRPQSAGRSQPMSTARESGRRTEEPERHDRIVYPYLITDHRDLRRAGGRPGYTVLTRPAAMTAARARGCRSRAAERQADEFEHLSGELIAEARGRRRRVECCSGKIGFLVEGNKTLIWVWPESEGPDQPVMGRWRRCRRGKLSALTSERFP